MDTVVPAALISPGYPKPGSTLVKLRKSYKNTLDIGSIEFDITLSTLTKWDKKGHALI